MKKKSIIIVLLALLTTSNTYAQISYSISFEKKKLNLKDKQSGKDNYTTIDYENYEADGQNGAPLLPFKYLTFYISDNANKLLINIKNIKNDTINLKDKILPIPQSIPTSISSFPNIADLEGSTYQSQFIYPENPVCIVQEGFVDGNNRIVIVRVSPVQYIESKKKVIFNSQIDFEIKAEMKTKSPTAPLFPVIKRDDVLFQKYLKIENIQDVEKKQEVQKAQSKRDLSANTIGVSMKSSNISNISLPVYNYVVITSESLAMGFEKLISWKKKKGLSAGIVTMQDILSDVNITGDTISHLYDDAGKLRQYLLYAWQRGSQYVLLAGQDSIVPVRYGTGGNYPPSQTPSRENTIPSDLYYSDLNGNWNYDNDQNLGESTQDRVDYFPELYVGRLLCKNRQEVDNYTNKLLIYEWFPGNGDFGYLRKAFYTQDDQLQENHQADSIANRFSSIFNTYDIYEEVPSYNCELPTFPTGFDVISKMNERYGLFGWFGHGGEYGISTSSDSVNTGPWHGITSIDSYNGAFQETRNGLDNLTNALYPAIAYTIACIVTPFDKYKFSTVPYSVGEGYTVAGNYGGPVFLGNTRYGWVNTSHLLFRKFIESLSNADYHLGKAEAISKCDYTSGDKHWLALTHHLIGCPELQMWSDIPSNMENITVTQNSNSLYINTVINNSTISVNGLFGGASYNNYLIGSSGTFTNVPTNYTVSVCKHNYLPYIYPLYLQNENITGLHYIFANSVFMGSNVAPEKESGNIIVMDGASVTIETSGVVTLDAGFNVELGGNFEIKNR